MSERQRPPRRRKREDEQRDQRADVTDAQTPERPEATPHPARERSSGAAPRAKRRAARQQAPDDVDQAPRREGDAPGAPTAPVAFSAEALALVERFAEEQPFPLDPFQLEAARHLADQRSVLVAAPTGTGKTVVAEFGIWLAQRAGLRAIYTAPLKALSNQKFRDLRARYGEDQVGLLTGDIIEHPRAPIVVMTTEIYRNMLLEGSRVARVEAGEEAETLVAPLREREAQRERARLANPLGSDEGAYVAADDIVEVARRAALDEELSTVGCVIFDELHYLSDPERGPVWEEAIIHSPAHVTFVGLSATVSNADELRRWSERVHGPIALVFHTERAVPIEHYFYLDGKLHLVQDAEGQRVERFPGVGGEAKLARMLNRSRRYDFYDDDEDEDDDLPDAVRELLRRERAEREERARVARQRRAGPPAPSTESASGESAGDATEQAPEREPRERRAPEPGEVLTVLREANLLPCIYFLPGRRAVEEAAQSARGHLLVSPEERARLAEEAQRWVEAMPPEDQKLDQVRRLLALIPRGVAFHHAGLLPGLKVMVERLFASGQLRAVFATDTLALGINMPARSVVLGSMSKFDGTQMRLLTPNEYQQLTGRAGRRGMDAKGAAVLLYSPWDAFEPSFKQLTGPIQPVVSAFTVRYNTVLNLWRPGDTDRLRIAVAASLREFQRRTTRFGRDVTFEPSGGRGRRAERDGERGRYGENPAALSRAAAFELNATIAVLRALDYIGPDDELTVKGRLLRAVFHPAGMILVELLVGGAFDGLNAGELAEVISWFTFDADRSLRNSNVLSQRLNQARREANQARQRVQAVESEEGVALSPGVSNEFHGVALNWSRGFSLGGLLRRIDMGEGDILVSLNQTIDLIQQLQGAVGQSLDARDLWNVARAGTRWARYLEELRARLERLRPTLESGWRGLLRGSVAQSRAIPSMATPTLSDQAAQQAIAKLPPLPMAEDEDPDEAIQDDVTLEQVEEGAGEG